MTYKALKKEVLRKALDEAGKNAKINLKDLECEGTTKDVLAFIYAWEQENKANRSKNITVEKPEKGRGRTFDGKTVKVNLVGKDKTRTIRLNLKHYPNVKGDKFSVETTEDTITLTALK